MSQLLRDAEAVLKDAGYRVGPANAGPDCVHFEDDSVLGALFVFESVDDLLESWERTQDSFLRENGAALSNAPTKAWNCYTVFLSELDAKNVDRSRLNAIEEDFRGSRKVVGAGVSTRDDVEAVLAPLLPLRHLLVTTRLDPVELLRERLGDENSPLQGLLSEVEIDVIVSWLLENS